MHVCLIRTLTEHPWEAVRATSGSLSMAAMGPAHSPSGARQVKRYREKIAKEEAALAGDTPEQPHFLE